MNVPSTLWCHLRMAIRYFIKDFGPILNFVQENKTMIAVFFCLVVIFLIVSIKLAIKYHKKKIFDRKSPGLVYLSSRTIFLSNFFNIDKRKHLHDFFS